MASAQAWFSLDSALRVSIARLEGDDGDRPELLKWSGKGNCYYLIFLGGIITASGSLLLVEFFYYYCSD